MTRFIAKIQIIGINPYVLLPEKVLQELFIKAGKEKGPIPVKGKIDNDPFTQTLVKYSGKWRLYLNRPMRNSAGKQVGDAVQIEITFDPKPRTLPMHEGLAAALQKNKKAAEIFESLPPSRKKEIIRYISSLKSKEAVDKNIKRAIGFLNGKGRFIGLKKPLYLRPNDCE